ncbi:ABC transporter permease subunit [bacterium]|nr:ABC transporter permease subunit [bacterium]
MRRNIWETLTKITAFLLVMGIAYFLYRERLHFALLPPHIPVEYRKLPIYTLWSLLRMFSAYILSLIFSYTYAYLAATSPRREGIMLAILDILQSVPVLGFFPAAVYFFVNLFHGSRIGVEMAAIFLIFTSQAWNITFSIYESIKTIPEEIKEAIDLMNISGLKKFFILIVPSSIPKVVYNSMMSWAGGWYFLIACEIIAIGPMNYHLPGLGSFLQMAVDKGRIDLALAGIGALVFVIFLMYFFIWQPLSYWAEKFRYEMVSSTAEPPLTYLMWVKIANIALISSLLSFIRRLISPILNLRLKPIQLPSSLSSYLRLSLATIILFLIAFGTSLAIISLTSSLVQIDKAYLFKIPAAILASAGRIAVAYILALLWTLPTAVYIASNKRRENFFMPLIQAFASIPAIAFFPFIVRYIVSITGNVNIATILLILTGSQWYLLFNLIGGVKSIPTDLRQLSAILGIRGFRYWRKILLPAVFPALITGSITAWGGAWNALIVAEWITFKGKLYYAFGIGYLLDYATYKAGNLALILISLASMSLTIVLLNKFFWRKMYELAERKYNFEA